jgi:4-hydroxybenzoate polyprenyltransferase
MLPGVHDNLITRFFTFFGSFPGIGISPGMRIEIALVLLGSFFYFLSKRVSLFSSLIYAVSEYALIFIYLAVPFVSKYLLGLIGMDYQFSNAFIGKFFFIIIFVTLAFLLYFYNRKWFRAIINDIRIFRLSHFQLMFFLGIILSQIFNPGSFPLDYDKLLDPIVISIAISFAWLFSVMTNNLADLKIDQVSSPKRPLIKNEVPKKQYQNLSWVLLILAFIYSGIVSFESLFLILLFTGNYFLYSMPPLRLKRVPFLSKLLISGNSLIVLLVGYSLSTDITKFPLAITGFFLIHLTAMLNFIDLKDYRGDKKAGIKTLPVILGLEKSKQLIGLFFVISYPLVSFMINKAFFLFFLGGFLQFFLINRKGYDEKPVLITCLITVSGLIGYLITLI